jgi:transcription elongation GreA/GreB family factor
MPNEALRTAVLANLEAELARQTHAALDSREESISEESRAENKYDTHAQEAAYLAEGQARLAAELAVGIAAWRSLTLPLPGHYRVQLGSLVTLAAGSRVDLVFLGPSNGGLTLDAASTGESREVTVITPTSPLGRALLGRTVGDVLPAPRKGAAAPRIAELA